MKQKTTINCMIFIAFILSSLTSCKKDITKSESPGTGDEQFYKNKVELLIKENVKNVKDRNIIFSPKDQVNIKVATYKELYDFISEMKKGVTSTKVDTIKIQSKVNNNVKTESTSSYSWGTESASFVVFCANNASVSNSLAQFVIGATWNVSGQISYPYTQEQGRPRKYIGSGNPSAQCSPAVYSFSGLGSMAPPTGGGWNSGNQASFTSQAQVQVTYSIGGTGGSLYIQTFIGCTLGWSLTPETVWASHNMTATAY